MLKLISIPVFCLFIQIATSTTQLTNCLDGRKTCLGLPKNCLGPACWYAFSGQVTGDIMEIELFGRNVSDDRTYLAVAYSSDLKMGDDIVVFCIRDDKRVPEDQKAGIAYNTPMRKNEIRAFIDEPEKDQDGMRLKLLEYNLNDGGMYCKMRHRVSPIRQKFNTTKVEVLMAKGIWMKEELSYHGDARKQVGQMELVEKKPRRKSGSAISVLVSTVSVAILRLFI